MVSQSVKTEAKQATLRMVGEGLYKKNVVLHPKKAVSEDSARADETTAIWLA